MQSPHVKKSFEKLVRAQQTGLVELLLLQIVVFVHWFHQSADHVDGRVADSVMTELQSTSNLHPDLFPESGQLSKSGETGLGSHKSSESVELLLQIFDRHLVELRVVSVEDGLERRVDQLFFVLRK